jgi:hypothetical protein
MTKCDDCGELTYCPLYLDNPYWIRCPRCASERRKELWKHTLPPVTGAAPVLSALSRPVAAPPRKDNRGRGPN